MAPSATKIEPDEYQRDQPSSRVEIERGSADVVSATSDLRARANATLDGIRRLVLGDSAQIDEGAIARLDAIEAAADAVIRLSSESSAASATVTASGSPAPIPEEVEEALRTLFDYSTSTRRAQWEYLVDVLVDSPTLDVDQLYQAHRHAERKRWLLANVRLLGITELTRLMPDRVDPDRNTARVLARLRSEGRLHAVQVKRDWKYPAAQLDARGEVHRALPDLLVRARSQGYDEWEILYWLARPTVEPTDDIAPGKPLVALDAHASLEEIASHAIERHAADISLTSGSVSPFELLARDDVTAFGRAARRWLG